MQCTKHFSGQRQTPQELVTSSERIDDEVGLNKGYSNKIVESFFNEICTSLSLCKYYICYLWITKKTGDLGRD